MEWFRQLPTEPTNTDVPVRIILPKSYSGIEPEKPIIKPDPKDQLPREEDNATK